MSSTGDPLTASRPSRKSRVPSTRRRKRSSRSAGRRSRKARGAALGTGSVPSAFQRFPVARYAVEAPRFLVIASTARHVCRSVGEDRGGRREPRRCDSDDRRARGRRPESRTCALERGHRIRDRPESSDPRVGARGPATQLAAAPHSRRGAAVRYFGGSAHAIIGPPVERAVSESGRCQSNTLGCGSASSACAMSVTGQFARRTLSVPLP